MAWDLADRDAEQLPVPAPTGNGTVDALLAALRDSPLDTTIRLILADAVEESLGRDGTRIRTVQPNVEDVMQRLWPGSQMVSVSRHVRYRVNESREIHSRHGGFIMRSSQLCDMIEGKTLLVDPEVARAAEMERTAAVLRMFGG